MSDPVDYFDLVFDGYPGAEGSRFIEAENRDGASIRVGEWITRDDGQVALRIEQETTVRHAWNDSLYAIADMIDRGVKVIPAFMLKTICERHGYTLLDNGQSRSKRR